MLRLAGRKANGWLPSLGPLTPQELREGNKIVDGAAEAAGRDPHDVRRILNLHGAIGEDRSAGRGRLPVGGYLSGQPLAGPPERWAETLAGFGDDGFDTVTFMPIERTTDQIERFAREVVPMLPGSAQ
jgi:alkanesulfonate monooxygenase SsuD/methylene tetrahydromethanopterin reductase-like flavin-dependent oxidoreductase (luciferase family)